MRVIGVDPGTRFLGWGVVEGRGTKLRHVGSGVLKLGDGPLPDRLVAIDQQLMTIIAEHQPTAGAVESIFFAKNAQTAAKLGHARGVVLLALRRADLSGMDLHGVDLRGADLTAADMRGADLRGANLTACRLTKATLRGALYDDATAFPKGSRVGLQRMRHIAAAAKMRGADLRWARLRGVDMRGVDLREADLRGASFSDANLAGAHLGAANLTGAALRSVRLDGADVGLAALRGAVLHGATLRYATLRGADLFRADLTSADLRDADMSGACLDEARARRAVHNERTVFPGGFSPAAAGMTLDGGVA